MYRTVIIDDEMIIRVGFRTLIDWENLGFEIVGDAADGAEGLELCRAVRPHVVFTDIVMAQMDGLTLIENIRRELPATKVVVLSCMEDFSILQKALRLGVEDYFVKLTLNRSQLLALVNKLKIQLDQEFGSKYSGNLLPDNMTAYTRMQNDYREFLQGSSSLSALPAYTNLSSDALIKSEMAVFLIEFDDLSQSGTVRNGQKTTIVALLRELFSRFCCCDIVEPDDSALMIVCDKYPKQTKDDMIETMQEVQATLFRMLHWNVSVAGSQSIDSLRQLSHEYRRLKVLEDIRFYRGERQTIYVDNDILMYTKENEKVNWSRLADQVSEKLEIYHFQEANRQLFDSLDLLQKEHKQRRKNVLDGIMLPLVQYERFFQKVCDEDDPVRMKPGDVVAQAITLEILKDRLKQYVIDVTEKIGCIVSSSGMNRDVLKAKQYAKEHLDNCNARTVAKYLCFNYSYFCSLFKRETGENFSEYLQQERMKQAEILKRTTNLDIADIASQVGYSDINHFKKLLMQFEQDTEQEDIHNGFNSKN